MGYALAIPTHAVALFMMAWYGGNWLNEHHPMGFTWLGITFPVAFLSIGHTFYALIKKIMRDEISEEKKNDGK